MREGPAVRAGGEGGAGRAGPAQPLRGAGRGGPGAGGAVVARRRDERRDRGPAGCAGRAGAALARGGPRGRGRGVAVPRPGRTPRKREAALAVARDVSPGRRLTGRSGPWPGWRGRSRRAPARRSRGSLERAPAKGGSAGAGRAQPHGRQDAGAVDWSGLRLRLLRQQAEAGDIVLLFGDEAEVLTHPYLAHAGPNEGPTCASPHRVKRASGRCSACSTTGPAN